MKNKTLLVLVLTLSFFLTATPSSFAVFELESLYTVHGVNDTVEDNTFEWDETPYLYIKGLDIPDTYFTHIAILFTPQNEGFSQNFGSNLGQDPSVNRGVSEYWLPSPVWNSESLGIPFKGVGTWQVDLIYTIFDSTKPEDAFVDSAGLDGPDYFFTVNAPVVTPEPATAALFLLGAGGLAARRFRRKK